MQLVSACWKALLNAVSSKKWLVLIGNCFRERLVSDGQQVRLNGSLVLIGTENLQGYVKRDMLSIRVERAYPRTEAGVLQLALRNCTLILFNIEVALSRAGRVGRLVS